MNSKTWLIVGGSGSLGNALTRRLLAQHDPRKIVIYSRGEVKQAAMRERIKDNRLRFIIGDVLDYQSLLSAMKGVDYVVLAAALKRVEVFTSTDKACQALNTYGASKFLAERVVINGNQYSGELGTRFACTRYGNVAGSRGSVIPIWQQQISAGEPIKVTSRDMTRFWMTLDESVDLIFHAFEHMRGGEVFVPYLPAYTLGTLADAMSDNQVEIAERPGEKKHETMISEDEAPFTVMEPGNRIYRILPDWYEKDNALRTVPCRLSSDTVTQLTWQELVQKLGELDNDKIDI
jgi:UDP-N-acetylglucosamine 4,6-dehydratase